MRQLPVRLSHLLKQLLALLLRLLMWPLLVPLVALRLPLHLLALQLLGHHDAAQCWHFRCWHSCRGC